MLLRLMERPESLDAETVVEVELRGQVMAVMVESLVAEVGVVLLQVVAVFLLIMVV